MALSYAVRRQLLEASLPESTEVRVVVQFDFHRALNAGTNDVNYRHDKESA